MGSDLVAGGDDHGLGDRHVLRGEAVFRVGRPGLRALPPGRDVQTSDTSLEGSRSPPRMCSRTTLGRVRAALPAWPGPGDNCQRCARSTSVISPWRASFDDRRRVRRARRRGARDASSVARRRRCPREWRPGGHRPALGVAHVRPAASATAEARLAALEPTRVAGQRRDLRSCRSAATPSVKVRDGRHGRQAPASASTTTASSSGCRSPRRPSRCRATDVRRGDRRAAARRRRRSSATPIHARASSRRGRRPSPDAARRRGAQAPRALHGRRLHDRAAPRCAPTTARRARSRSSPRTRRAWSRPCARSASSCRPNVSVPRELKTLVGLRRAPLRGHRRRHELGEVPPRRARAPTAPGGPSPTARSVTRLGEGLDDVGPAAATSRSSAPSRDRRAWPTEARARRRRGRSPRWAPPGCGWRPTRAGSSTRCARGAASRSRSSPARRRAGSPTSAAIAGARAGRGDRWWCSTPAGAVRSSRSATASASTSASAWTSAPCASPSASGSTAPVDEARWPRRSSAIAADLGAPRRPPVARARRRHGRRGDEPRGRQARPRALRPRRRAGHGARPRPRSTARSSSTARGRADERRAIVGLQPARAEVILAGACIVRTVLDASSAATRSRSATAACATALLAERFGQRAP